MSNRDIAFIFSAGAIITLVALSTIGWARVGTLEKKYKETQSALVRSQETISEAGVNLPAQKAFDYSNEYPAPFNIRVTCTHRGAPAKLSPDAAPKPGDRLIRDCVVARIGPSG